MNQPTFFFRFEVKGWGASWDLKDPISVGWPDAFSSESSGGISTPGRIGVTPGEWLQARSSNAAEISKFRAVSKGCWVWERKCHFWILCVDTFLNYFIMMAVVFPRRIILMQQIEDDTPEGLKGTSFVWGLKSVIAWQELLAFWLVLAKSPRNSPRIASKCLSHHLLYIFLGSNSTNDSKIWIKRML